MSDWLELLPEYVRKDKEGSRLDLRLHVYPDGHGDIVFLGEGGVDGANQPVGGVQEAIATIEGLWRRAASTPPPDDIPPMGDVGELDRGRRMGEALRALGRAGAYSEVEDPVAWQRELRQDRPLPGRDS